MSEERFEQIKDSIKLQELVKTQIGVDDELLQEEIELLNAYEQLKDNWNKLKEYIRETKLKEFENSYDKRYGKIFTQAEIIVCNMILDKIQELEQGSDSDE